MMILSSLLFAVMAYYAKMAALRIPGPEVALVRFAFGVLVGLLLASGRRITLRPVKKRLVIIRGVFGGVAILLYFWALARGNMTNATILNNTYPIFSTIAAVFYLQEKLDPLAGFSLLVSWVGVALLIHPDFRHIFWPDLLALLSGILGGLAVTAIRELRRNNEAAWTIFFYLSSFGLLVSVFAAVPVWVWPDWQSGIYLLAAAFFGLIAQLAMTYSYKYCSTAIGGVLSMTTMLFAACVGFIGFGERLSPGETWGALLIGIGSALVIWLNDRPVRKAGVVSQAQPSGNDK